MAHSQQTSGGLERGESLIGRVGFWLGLALFASLIILPPPQNMHRAIRQHFTEAIRADVAHRLKCLDQAVAPHDSEMYRQTTEKIVTERAHTMMAAAAVTALVACWWMTLALPLPVTSLLPLVLFPLVGVLPVGRAAIPYANSHVFLFMGGFILALAVERWGLHRRIALHIVRMIGTSQSTIVLGFMLASAVLSMWISNTATTLMMLPIGLAIVAAMSEPNAESGESGRSGNFAAALMLGIAYGASIGGIATPIGTPPNIAFRGQWSRLFPEAAEIGFGQWMILFVPMVTIFLPMVWLVLVKITCPVSPSKTVCGRAVVTDELRRLGSMRRPEKRVMMIFIATALLWMTRSIPVGDVNYGWSGLLERGMKGAGNQLFRADYINDATVAVGMAVLLFMIPAGRSKGSNRHDYLMNWETSRRLPWGILLLFGGGFSIAEGFQSSGLSAWCGEVFAGFGMIGALPLILLTCLMMTFLTEITSNTATTQVMLPILARVAQTMGINPLMLMLPATLSASCAFMLPVATPPNAIVFGSGHVEMKHMVRSGLVINLIGVLLISATFFWIARPVLGVE